MQLGVETGNETISFLSEYIRLCTYDGHTYSPILHSPNLHGTLKKGYTVTKMSALDEDFEEYFSLKLKTSECKHGMLQAENTVLCIPREP